MSLDVSLIVKEKVTKAPSSGIFVRENGQTKEISAEEWRSKNPGINPTMYNQVSEETNEVYTANITHNLNAMADSVGLYRYLWRPEELGITKAKELIDPLRNGLHNLKLDPETHKKFNPSNGWGNYEILVEFIEHYLNACYKYPEAEVIADR
jgi:hypothetical protein